MFDITWVSLFDIIWVSLILIALVIGLWAHDGEDHTDGR